MQPVQDGLFDLDDDRTITLVGGYSHASGRHHFPRLPACPFSGATDVEPVRLSRRATLWAWTAVTAAPPGYAGPVPYGFGVVELTEERLRIVTRLREADPSQLEFGQPMELVADVLPGEVVTWAFA